MSKKTMKFMVLMLLTMLSVVGCGSGPNKSIPESSVSTEAKAYDTSSINHEIESVIETNIELTNQKLIHRGDLRIEVTDDVSSIINDLNEYIRKNKGYIENMEQYRYGYDQVTQKELEGAHLTIRIPHESYDSTIEKISNYGNVTDKGSSVEDVTLAYSDIESTLKMYKIEQDRLLKMLENEASDIKDMIEIEKRLSEVRVEIEKQESARRALESMINYDTIELEIRQVRRTSQDEGTRGFLSRIKTTFIMSIDRTIVVTQDIILGITYLLIPGTFTLLVLGIAYAVIKKIKRNQSK